MVGLTRRLASILGLVKDTVTVPSDVPLDLTTSISSQTIRHVSVTLEDISLEPCKLNHRSTIRCSNFLFQRASYLLTRL